MMVFCCLLFLVGEGMYFSCVEVDEFVDVENEDWVGVFVELSGGCVGSLEVSCVVVGLYVWMCFEVYGMCGVLVWVDVDVHVG